MRTKLKKMALLSLGWAFMGMGIVGLFLPFLQGVLFLLIGLVILSSEYVWAHRLLQKARARFPAAARRFDEASRKASAWFSRWFGRDPGSKQ